MPGSRPPCNGGVLALLVEIDATTAKWEPHEKTTADRLRQLAQRDRAPEDVPLLDEYREQIEAWTIRAAELLADTAPTVPIRLPCPSCGRSHYYRRDGAGETVRSWVLRVSEAGASCQACEASWSTEQFGFLAKLLGCPALPA